MEAPDVMWREIPSQKGFTYCKCGLSVVSEARVVLFFLMWIIFKVFIEFVTISLLFYVLFFWPRGMWDLSSPTRDQTHTPCTGRRNLNQCTTREVPRVVLFLLLLAVPRGLWVPRPGIEPTSTALKARVLTTGPPGNSRVVCFINGNRWKVKYVPITFKWYIILEKFYLGWKQVIFMKLINIHK